jgi:hypothetical protein
LREYIAEMSAWVKAARLDETSAPVIPVGIPATPENAAKLESRLHLLDLLVIPKFV